MDTLGGLLPGAFCWLDLAATDEGRARGFYAEAFGWTFAEQRANGGRYTRCLVGDRAIGSLYPLRRSDVDRGVPSHWTPYLRVDSVDAAARRVASCGGRILVAPFDVEATARIALAEDAVGALIGLWEPARPSGPAPAGGAD